MTNERNRKHKKRKKEAEMNFFATKATFVAGIVVLITIVKDILELCIQFPVGVVMLYLSICFIVYIVVLCTTIVDKKIIKIPETAKIKKNITCEYLIFCR